MSDNFKMIAKTFYGFEEILSEEMKEILNPMEREINLIIIFQILIIFKENLQVEIITMLQN